MLTCVFQYRADAETAVRVPRAVYISPLHALRIKIRANLSMEQAALGMRSHRRQAGRPSYQLWRTDFIRRHGCATFSILSLLVAILVFIAVMRTFFNEDLPTSHRYETLPAAERAPFACGYNPDHWHCTARFAGPRAEEMEKRMGVLPWMDAHCGFQTVAGVWMCAEENGSEAFPPTGDEVWVEKVSDEMMLDGASVRRRGVRRPCLEPQKRGNNACGNVGDTGMPAMRV